MKKYLLVFVFIFLITVSQKSFCQSLQDTKDFIKEQIESNNALDSYTNAFWYSTTILQIDAGEMAGKILTNDEFENILISFRDVFRSTMKNDWLLSAADIIDIRDIYKVSIVKNTEQENRTYYAINVYINNKYYSKGYKHEKGSEAEHSYISKMTIYIGNNYEAAQKIKKAFIHLGQLKGIVVKDGDLF